MNPELFEMFPNLEFDSYITIGSETTGGEHPSAIWGDISASDEFDGDASGFNVTVDDNVGGAWYLPFPGLEAADTHPGFAGDDQRVLLMQMTTAGPISGQIQVQIFQNGDQDQEIREVFLFDSEAAFDDCDNLDDCDGITDECGVCNGPGAVFDCGCTVIPTGDCDCDGNQLDAVGTCGGDCVEDTDGDGICDVVAEGCTDETACNYVVAVTDDGSCEYAEEFYDCDGTCVNDTDGDGVCDELEIPGCTDDTACNYSADATDDDGSCATLDECGECGGTGTLGCTDDAACNFDADADCDDASCTSAPSDDGDGACLNDADADGICDELKPQAAPTPQPATTTPTPQTTTAPASTPKRTTTARATASTTPTPTASTMNSRRQDAPTRWRATTTRTPRTTTARVITPKRTTTARQLPQRRRRRRHLR